MIVSGIPGNLAIPLQLRNEVIVAGEVRGNESSPRFVSGLGQVALQQFAYGLRSKQGAQMAGGMKAVLDDLGEKKAFKPRIAGVEALQQILG